MLTGPARRALSPVTSLGWTVAAIGVGTWWLGAQLDWEELLILAGACLIALVIALVWTIGRLALDIDVPESRSRGMRHVRRALELHINQARVQNHADHPVALASEKRSHRWATAKA